MVMKLKISNCDETQKFKLWSNSKTQFVIKLKTKLKKSNGYKTKILTKLKLLQNSNCDKTQTLTKSNNSKCDQTQIVTKCFSNCDKNWIMININLWKEKLISNGLFKEHFDTLTTNAMFSGQRFAILAMFIKFLLKMRKASFLCLKGTL